MVQENIELFGGDRDRVTIFGESAGAAAIGHLALSPLTGSNGVSGNDLTKGGPIKLFCPFQRLFAQGIGQSGSSTALWAFDTEPEYNSRAVAARLECDNPDNHTMIVECLRGKTPKEVMDAYDDHKVTFLQT